MGNRKDDPPVSTDVVKAVSEATGTPTDELDPLYSVVDPDALETLVADSPGQVRVSFEYCGCEVTVTNEEVQVD